MAEEFWAKLKHEESLRLTPNLVQIFRKTKSQNPWSSPPHPKGSKSRETEIQRNRNSEKQKFRETEIQRNRNNQKLACASARNVSNPLTIKHL
jgi:hypothetical protein